MVFRIGVHLGDVTVEGERIYGDGVNIAARIQELAEPGGICISGAVHEQVDSKLGLGWDDLGEQTVKNIPKSVRVFRVRAEAPAVETVTSPATSDRPSIVVLPFADMSQEKDQEFSRTFDRPEKTLTGKTPLDPEIVDDCPADV